MSIPNILFSFMPRFLYSQFFITPHTPRTDCTGKTIIVTGANAGLGKEAARHFLRLNASKVVLACRSVERGEAARKDLENSTGRSGVVEVWQLDLGSYDSVKSFAEKAKTLERLDAVVENAGVLTQEFSVLEGNESTITVNVVSTFLLALLMIPKLQETAMRYKTTPNLTVVTSELHFVSPFSERKATPIFETLNDKSKANMTDRYNLSKLLEVFVCREIARQHSVDQLKFTMNFVNPGWCHSELMREVSNPAVAITKKLLARTTEVGSRTLVHAALAGRETHGQYLHNCQIKPCAPLVEGKEGDNVQKRVWEELADKLEEIQPGIIKVLDS